MKIKQKSLNRRIFVGSMLIALLVLVIIFVMVLAVTYRQYTAEFRQTLNSEAEQVANAIELGGLDILDDYPLGHRITVVDTDGTVVYDSEVDPSTLENHAEREEIAEAFATGHGDSNRESATVDTRTINEAILMDNGMVLRISGTQSSLRALFQKSLLPMAGVAVLAVLISLLLSLRLSASVTQPINQMDLEHPSPDEVYTELTPLMERLTALQREHELRDQMRRDFTANVSHELKTPLTSIAGYAELIKEGIAKEEDVPVFAGRIHDESQRLITLVGDIIKLSQLDGNDVRVRNEDVDLYELSSMVLNQLEHAAERRSVTLKLEGGPVTVHGAAQVIEEIIFNLCDNAIKYNRPDGSVTVTVSKTQDAAVLTVADTGTGIPQEEIPYVFERFYRVDKSHSKEVGGTGLGLSIVKHGIRFMNAQLEVESEVDKGTTFHVRFPLSTE